jgi:anti-sigma factor RsiW
MSEDIHKKAETLLVTSRVEGISDAEREWLSSHLEACAQCRARAEALGRTLATLRSFPAAPAPALVEATRRRVRARALELREQQSRRRGLWIACVLSWLFGAVSAPPLWFAFKWLGQRFDLPQPLWIMALAVYWIVPAVAGAAALAWRGSRNSQAEEGAANTSR